MGASIHINGTGSSVIDSVFVCRHTGRIPRKWIADSPEGVAGIIRNDIDLLSQAGLDATQGDIRCIAHGHLIRLAIWNLRGQWAGSAPTAERMNAVRAWLSGFGGLEVVFQAVGSSFHAAARNQDWPIKEMFREETATYDEISF
jgi:hypothetical protein